MVQKNKSRFKILLSYIILSIIIHLVSLPLFLKIDKKPTVYKKKKFHIVLKKRQKIKKKEKKKKDDLKNKQIVDIKRPDKEITPKKAKFLSKFNSHVKKETKAKKKNNIIKKTVDVKNTVKSPQKKSQLKQKVSDKKTVSEKQQKKKTENIKKTSRSTPKFKKDFNKDSKEKNPNKIKLNFSSLQFSKMLEATSNDYLKDIKEDNYTSLNTLAYEYTGYFIKIKNRVAKNWNPEAAYQKYDPYRKIYGIKDRYTVLLVTINKDGYLKKIKILQSCGLSFLDKEAVKAFEKGQPYKIVPKGLLKDKDYFTIRFGFYVDNPSSPQVFYLK